MRRARDRGRRGVAAGAWAAGVEGFGRSGPVWYRECGKGGDCIPLCARVRTRRWPAASWTLRPTSVRSLSIVSSSSWTGSGSPQVPYSFWVLRQMGRSPRLSTASQVATETPSVLGAEVVEDDDAVGEQQVAGRAYVVVDVFVQVRGVYVDEAAAVRADLLGDHGGGRLDHRGQVVMEGQVVAFEGLPGERGVRLRRLGAVGPVRCLAPEQVADRELLAVLPVVAEQDRTLAQVGAELHQVAPEAACLLPFEEPGEQGLVQRRKPAGDVFQLAGILVGCLCSRHESSVLTGN